MENRFTRTAVVEHEVVRLEKAGVFSLPKITEVQTGKAVTIKAPDRMDKGGIVVVSPDSNIDGVPAYRIKNNLAAIMFVSDGKVWSIV